LHDFGRDTVALVDATFGSPVQCAISRAALDDHFGAAGLDNAGRVEVFHKPTRLLAASLKIMNKIH
jgi:hypothetical protein